MAGKKRVAILLLLALMMDWQYSYSVSHPQLLKLCWKAKAEVQRAAFLKP